MKGFLHSLKHPPRVLEVGIDAGTSLIPLLVFLTRTREEFYVVGVDIKVREQLAITLNNIDVSDKQNLHLVEANSLDVMPKLIESNMKFDLLLLDGDHNYHTVSKELQYLDALLEEGGMAIIDDYEGRWAEKDLWYAERDGYQDVKIATQKIDTEKHGVKTAVDEFLEGTAKWTTSRPIGGEPIVLTRSSGLIKVIK